MRDIIRAVLAANSEFYRAFNQRDDEAMADLWAIRLPVACIHPGWDALTDREEVLDSWSRILANPEQPSIECRNEVPFLWEEMAMVICHEIVGDHLLAATNMFRLEEGEWRMVHHQSSPMAVSIEEAAEQTPPSSTRRLH